MDGTGETACCATAAAPASCCATAAALARRVPSCREPPAVAVPWDGEALPVVGSGVPGGDAASWGGGEPRTRGGVAAAVPGRSGSAAPFEPTGVPCGMPSASASLPRKLGAAAGEASCPAGDGVVSATMAAFASGAAGAGGAAFIRSLHRTENPGAGTRANAGPAAQTPRCPGRAAPPGRTCRACKATLGTIRRAEPESGLSHSAESPWMRLGTLPAQLSPAQVRPDRSTKGSGGLRCRCSAPWTPRSRG